MYKNISRRNFLLTATGILALTHRAKSQQPKQSADYSSVINRFRERVPEDMKQYDIPGLAIALVDANGVIWSEGFGYTDRSKQIKVTDETLFSLQSISKTYTAMGVLRAIDKGLLRLDDRIRKYVPKFTVKSRFSAGRDEAEKITIRHLLSHWAGLCHEAPCGNNYVETYCPFEEHIKSISQTWLVAPVGSRFSYSNLGIDLAGYILQLRSQMPFEKFIAGEIFAPLKMSSSTFDQEEAKANLSFAKGQRGQNELPIVRIPMIPAGGMYSSVKDMARFVSSQLQGGKVNGRYLISEKLLEEMRTPQFTVKGQIGGYGLGLYSVSSFNSTKFLHSGGGYGYSADQRWMPEYGVGVVVLTNQQTNSLAPSFANKALELMIKAKYGDIPKAKSVETAIVPTVTPSTKLLRRLEGSYSNSQMTFKVEENNLLQITGNEKNKLEAYSSTEFVSGSRKYKFDLDGKGKPKGVWILDHGFSGNSLEYRPLNDTPTDEAGPNRKEWLSYIGKYEHKLYGISTEINVFVKNGYLYASWQDGVKLKEYKPGIFFTPNGEAVIFENGKLTIGNRPFTKKNSIQILHHFFGNTLLA